MSHGPIPLLRTGLEWGVHAQKIINNAIQFLNVVKTELLEDDNAFTGDNTFSGTSNFTGALQLDGVGLLSGLRGHIAGLTCSNNGTDATNDIDIAVGAAMADDQSALMVLGSALTKRTDAAWAVGTNQGGWLDGASMPDGVGHVFEMRRSDTGVVDIGMSASTAPTLPTGYDQKRRIWSILRESAAIVAFEQYGDVGKRAAVTDRSSTAAAASALLALSIPAGIAVQPLIQYTLSAGVSVICQILMGSASAGSANTNVVTAQLGAGDSVDNSTFCLPPVFTSNTSSQIYFAQLNTAGTPASSTLNTIGWIDRRGKDD